MTTAIHRSAPRRSEATWIGLAIGLIASVGASAAILWYFHDKFWYAPDEGIYAHLAERLFNGEVPHRDNQDIHAGYITFANALAFKLFGVNLLSLRYPLVFMGVVQSMLVYFLFVRRGPVVAFTAAISLASLTTVQFFNPTANWYVLFLFVVLVSVLAALRPGSAGRIEAVGFLLVALFLFRQLSGVLIATGVVGYLLYELQVTARRAARGATIAGRLLIGTTAIGLGAYLVTKTDLSSFFLFGVWPLGVLLLVGIRLRADDRQVLGMTARLALGGMAAVAPLIVYLGLNGAIGAWLDDTFLTAFAHSRLEFVKKNTYDWLFAGSLVTLIRPDDVAAALSGFFWIALLLASAVNGGLVLWRTFGDRAMTAGVHPLPFLAVFYALVSANYRIPIYLTFSAAISLAGLLWLISERPRPPRAVAAAVAMFLSVVGLAYHASEPLSRGALGIVTGRQGANDAPCPATACGLIIERADAETYAAALRLIERHTAPTDTIFSVPLDPQFYFLTKRRNPFRFYSTAVGVRSEADLQRVRDAIERTPPKIVIYRADDKYNTTYSRRIMKTVRKRYRHAETIGAFEFYLRPDIR